MRQRFRSWWFDLQYTLWFVPSLMTLAAVVLAFVMIRLDREVLADADIHRRWLFEGGAEGARGVLSTIAGTMITVATTAFSITIVALQLGSSQFSPRILRGFTRDRGNQLVLGIFIATFAYAVLVLRSIRSESSDSEVFVPSAAVSLAILLAFAAIGSLIFFFHHATRAIQASVVIERAVQDTFKLIDARLTRDAEEDGTVAASASAGGDTIAIVAGDSGYLISIDLDTLLDIAESHGLVLTVFPQVGDHLLSITSLAAIPAPGVESLSPDDRGVLEKEVRKAFRIDMERTVEHDLLLGFRQLSDIAVKALSPGINDPTTASLCIDRIGEALTRVRGLRADTRFRAAPGGTGGVCYTVIGLDDILNECIPQIRHFGAGDVLVGERLLTVLGAVAAGAEPRAIVSLAG
ncbi:MAG: DUF2254 domain-containing protein, partial [Chloroflexia bacterium]|nr:DUF2254 domain-containing protein [Chloroflexia bacterium]